MGIAYFSRDTLGLGRSSIEAPLTVPVRKQNLDVVVTEKGSLESTVTVDGICELQGPQNKIIFLVPEGNRVEKGEVVCRFDSAEIDKSIAQQEIKAKQAEGKLAATKQDIEIQRNDGESKVAEATVELRLAELNLQKYQEGDYNAEIADMEGNIAQNTQKLEEAVNKLEQYKDLVKRGFKSLEQLRSVEQEHSQFKSFVERDRLKLQIKRQFEYQLKTVELQSKVDQSRSKIERAKATLEAQLAKAQSEYEAAEATLGIEERQLKELLEQKTKTEIKADQSGVVAYANEPWYDSSRQIREGAVVYSRQKIFSLPDMSNMQVVVNIHESLVKKVKVGQTAEIRIDAFPNLVLEGKVKSVAHLADSNRYYDSGGAKVYKTVVSVERMPHEELRPSMTAEVKIQVRTLHNALVVPIQAVAERKGKHHAYVVDARGDIQRREVEVGESNEKLIQVMKGLEEGELVVLDARKRLDAEAKAESDKGASEPAEPDAGTSTSPGTPAENVGAEVVAAESSPAEPAGVGAVAVQAVAAPTPAPAAAPTPE